jgi:hypothetical protein
MATKKITELPLINTISGSYSVVPIVIGNTVGTGNTDQISIENFSKFVTAYSAHTGSAGNIFTGPQTINNNVTITGNEVVNGNVTISGRLTVNEVYAHYETASIIYSDGSNKFGDSVLDKHEFTGSSNFIGSVFINGENYTAYSSSNSTLFTNYSSSDSTKFTNYSSSNAIYVTALSSSNSTTFTNFSSSDSTKFTNYSSSNSTTFTNFSSSNASYVTLLSSSNSTTFTNFSSSNQTYVTALSSSNSTTFTNFSSSNSTTITNISSSTANTINGLSSNVGDNLSRVYQTTASLNQFTGSQDNRNFVISQFTASTNNHIVGISTFTSSQYDTMARVYQTTSSLQSTTASLNQFTASQDSRNLTLSTVTGSLIGITNGLMAFTAALDSTYATDAQLYQLYQATRSLELHSGSMVGITNQLMVVTSSMKAGGPYSVLYNDSNSELGSNSNLQFDGRSLTMFAGLGAPMVKLYMDGIFTSIISGSYYMPYENISGDAILAVANRIKIRLGAGSSGTISLNANQGKIELTGSVYVDKGIYGAISASNNIVSSSTQIQNYDLFALNSNLYTSTGSLIGITNDIMALTASMKNSTIVSSSTQIQNYDVFALNSNLYTSTGSLIGITNGIMALTASMKAATIVSSSTQIQNYFTFAQTASVNTFYGNQIVTGGLDVRDGVTGSFKGNLNGTATYAGTVSMGNSSTNQNYALVFTTAGSNGYLSQYTDAFGGMLYNPSTNKLTVSGSVEVSGSVYGNVTAQPVNGGNTASLDISNANFFTVTFADNITTHISASNVKAGQSVNILVTTGTNTTASFSTNIKQPSGSFYLPTSGSGNKDVLSLVAFDSNSLYLVAVNQMI